MDYENEMKANVKKSFMEIFRKSRVIINYTLVEDFFVFEGFGGGLVVLWVDGKEKEDMLCTCNLS